MSALRVTLSSGIEVTAIFRDCNHQCALGFHNKDAQLRWAVPVTREDMDLIETVLASARQGLAS